MATQQSAPDPEALEAVDTQTPGQRLAEAGLQIQSVLEELQTAESSVTDRTEELLKTLPPEKPMCPRVFATAVALLEEMTRARARVKSLMASATLALDDASQDIALSRETVEVLERRMQAAKAGHKTHKGL